MSMHVANNSDPILALDKYPVPGEVQPPVEAPPSLYSDEELELRSRSDEELRQNILVEAARMVGQLKALNAEETWTVEEEDGISIVIDLIHPVHVFLTQRWGPDKEKYIYDSYRYRFADGLDYGPDCLDSVFQYLASPDWNAFVEAIDFSSCSFEQPWVVRGDYEENFETTGQDLPF